MTPEEYIKAGFDLAQKEKMHTLLIQPDGDVLFANCVICNVLKLVSEIERLRGYNAQCDLIAVENARLWKEKIDSLFNWAALWKRKAKELYRVIDALDEEHTNIVTSNMRLARENAIMRDALRHYAGTAGAHARRALSKLERGE